MTPEQIRAIQWQIIEGIVNAYASLGKKELGVALAASWDRRVEVTEQKAK